MNGYEMEGFLRGKCLPGDMKVNESNAQYLVRKFSEFESNLSESQREFRAADATIHNLELQLTDMAVQLANAESKCRELAAVVAENVALKNPDNWLSQSDYGYEASEVATQNGATEDESLRAGMVAIINRIETPATETILAGVRSEVIDWLDVEISAIDPVYRGDPSYEHDAYWMKNEVRDLVESAKIVFACQQSQQEAAQ
ncbi:hypothetical protein PTU02_001990 [Escherichia coli]|nr:hypothetical protein [Escherichia coli]